jgi:hypothetical protein
LSEPKVIREREKGKGEREKGKGERLYLAPDSKSQKEIKSLDFFPLDSTKRSLNFNHHPLNIVICLTVT